MPNTLVRKRMLSGKELTFLEIREDPYLFDRLRHERDPYLGFVDCAKRIIDEEGWQTLYRAWWVTLLAAVASATAAATEYQENIFIPN